MTYETSLDHYDIKLISNSYAKPKMFPPTQMDSFTGVLIVQS